MTPGPWCWSFQAILAVSSSIPSSCARSTKVSRARLSSGVCHTPATLPRPSPCRSPTLKVVPRTGHRTDEDYMHKAGVNESVLYDHPTLYSCEGQVGHKLSFIKQYIPSEAPLILVGHSIGCHMVLEILKRAPDLNVQKAVLLFPAIESLDACPRVSIISPLVTYLRPLTVATLSALRLLPRVVQNLLIRLYIFLATACTTPHRSSLRGAVNYFRPECLMACFVFTRDIIQNVRERDNETIARHADKLTVYYGQNDHWSPVEYYDDMRRTFPEADVRLCERGFRHAFVLDRSADVGCMVREWIETLLS
ncbi:lipid droplet-associated hydrolase-like isoform X2 [Amblyomma americanum]